MIGTRPIGLPRIVHRDKRRKEVHLQWPDGRVKVVPDQELARLGLGGIEPPDNNVLSDGNTERLGR